MGSFSEPPDKAMKPGFGVYRKEDKLFTHSPEFFQNGNYTFETVKVLQQPEIKNDVKTGLFKGEVQHITVHPAPYPLMGCLCITESVNI